MYCIIGIIGYIQYLVYSNGFQKKENLVHSLRCPTSQLPRRDKLPPPPTSTDPSGGFTITNLQRDDVQLILIYNYITQIAIGLQVYSES